MEKLEGKERESHIRKDLFPELFFPISVMTSLAGSGVVPMRIFRVSRERNKLVYVSCSVF